MPKGDKIMNELMDDSIIEEDIQLQPCHCRECDMIRKEFLINKLKDKKIISSNDVFWFTPAADLIWKNSCPSCGGDMRFSFGDCVDSVEKYVISKTDKIEYQAFCNNKECCGHIDNCGMVC
jgi:hypothetical protein